MPTSITSGTVATPLKVLPKPHEVIGILGCDISEWIALPTSDKYDLLEAYARQYPKYVIRQREAPVWEPLPDFVIDNLLPR